MSSHHTVLIWNDLQHAFSSVLFILNKNRSSMKAGPCFACSCLYRETSNSLRTSESHNRHSRICWMSEWKSLTDQAFRQSCLILNKSLNFSVSYWLMDGVTVDLWLSNWTLSVPGKGWHFPILLTLPSSLVLQSVLDVLKLRVHFLLRKMTCQTKRLKIMEWVDFKVSSIDKIPCF